MMKNLIAITCFVVALVSCNKVEHKLEGKWQLKTVEAKWGGPDGGYGLV